jgi:hypothetical protein
MVMPTMLHAEVVDAEEMAEKEALPPLSSLQTIDAF